MLKIWHEVGSKFTIRNPALRHETLPPAVYILQWDSIQSEFYLELSQPGYTFGKLYDLDTDFINRVMRTYSATKANLGVLLVGTKGTGKSVTAKQLCNRAIAAGLPTILIAKSYDGIGPFLNMIKQDIAVFVDEYEKVFNTDNGRDAQLLSIMDGAFDNGARRMFLLTSNSMRVNDNMIQRPGRVRYLKKYEDTPLSTIILIVDDRLQHKELRDETIKFISEMDIITIDIICAILDEVNIHHEPPAKFAGVFNIRVRVPTRDVFTVEPDGTLKLHTAYIENIHPDYIGCEGIPFRIGHQVLGRISKVIEPNTVEVTANGEPGTTPVTTYKILPGSITHPVFKSYF